MPNQLYGRTEDPGANAPPESKLVPQGPAPVVGMGQANISDSQQEANSPYANFEDIFNKNRNYAAKAASQTAGKVEQGLGGLTGRGPANAGTSMLGSNFGGGTQSFAPKGQAEQLGLPGYTSLAKNPVAQQPQSIGALPHASDLNQIQAQIGQPASYKAPPAAQPQKPKDDLLGAYGKDKQALDSEGGVTRDGAPVAPIAPLGTTQTQLAEGGVSPEIAAKQAEYDELNSLVPKVMDLKDQDAKQTAEEMATYDKYNKADQQLDSYKSDEGLALMQEADPTSTIWDAGLMNQGGGRDAFSELEKNFGDYNKEYGAEALGNMERRSGQIKDMESRINQISQSGIELDALKNKRGPEGAGSPGAASTQNPFGYKSLDEMMADGGAVTDALDGIHGASQVLDPVSGFMNLLGEDGVYSGGTVSEEFRKGVGLGSDLDMQNVRGAFTGIEKAYGREATEWLFNNLSADDWAALQGMNGGAVKHYLMQKMDAWLHEHARQNIEKTGKTREASEITKTGGGGNADYGTSAEDESARNEIAKGYPYTDSNGKTWTSLAEWDAAHRK